MSAVVAGVEEGQLYHFGFTTHWDEWHERRDPYARATQVRLELISDSIATLAVSPKAKSI